MSDDPGRIPLRGRASQRRIARDVDDEILGHIELKARDLEAEGLDPDEAWRRATEAFGLTEPVGAELVAIQRGLERRRWRTMWIGELRGDVAWALRSLARAPGFSAFAALTLALGIAANTSVFSVVNGLFLRDLPGVRNPETLVDVWRAPGFVSSSYPMYEHLRDNAPGLEGLAAFDVVGLAVENEGGPEVVMGLQVTGNYFDVLGTRPAVGRFFAPDEGAVPVSAPSVVLSHAFWQRRFGGDPSVVGSAIRMNGELLTVVGVAEEGFGGHVAVMQAAAFVPVGTPIPGVHRESLTDFASSVLEMIGRVPRGTDVHALSAQLAQLANQRARSEDPEARERSIDVLAWSPMPSTVRGPVGAFVAVLSALVGLLLLISCVNVANLLLSRSAARRQEIAVRMSLGAGRKRLVRQLLTESVLLALLAGALGVLLTYWITGALSAFQLPVAPMPGLRLDLHLTPDGKVLTYSMALAAATGVVFGLAPALRATRSDLASDLGNAARAGRRGGKLQTLLVSAQVAGTIVLLAGSGLFLRAVVSVETLDPGFTTDDVYVAGFDLQFAGRSASESWPFYDELRRRALTLPGVRAASLAGKLPIAGLSQMAPVGYEGVEPPEGLRGYTLANQSVGPDYFEVVGTPVLEGRGFSDLDGREAERVVVVNERLRERFWPGQSALGKQISVPRFDGTADLYRVVGVVGTAKYTSLAEEPRVFAFFPASQRPRTDMILHLKMAPGAAAPFDEVRTLAAGLEPAAPVLSTGSLDAAVGIFMLPQRLGAWITGLVGGFGLLLGGLGVYGITAYWVARRTREVGIRIALGAGTGTVLRQVITRGMRAPALGAAVGLAIALSLSGFLEAFIFGVSPFDLITFGGVVAVLGLVALVANLVPAARAARIDPVEALGSD